MDRYDVIVSGGGIAGLIAATGFGSRGFSVLCLDPAPPITQADDPNADLRTTAFLQPAQALLAEIGLWDHFAPSAMPLQTMRIIDSGGPEPGPRVIREFDAAEISEHPFGWNLPNWLLRRELMARLNTLDNVRLEMGVGTADLLPRDREVLLRKTDHSNVRAKMVIAADGRNSPVRNALNIPVKTIRYGQKALAFAATHPIPHKNVSTEIHRTGGPFTLVPLPDHEGMPCSAIVWMEEGVRATELLTLPQDAFEAEMSARSCHMFGPLTLASRRTIWPIIAQMAQALNGPRCALVAEAAHVVPPIGAQGLNMSLADIRTLLDLATANPDALGDQAMLAQYHRQRHLDIRMRVMGIDALNRASMAALQPLRDLRAKGLDALYSSAPVRKMLMQMGLGMSYQRSA